MNFHGPVQGGAGPNVTGVYTGTGGIVHFNFDGNSARAKPKPSSNVPFRRDDDFVERGDILTRIDERCSRPAGRAALVGFGGFGLPETWIFWLHASNAARLEEAYSDIAARVGLLTQPGNTAENLQLVRRWLSDAANGQWLMIVDNADDEVTMELGTHWRNISLAPLLPQSDHGAVLITSRDTDVARGLVGREQDIIAVAAMDEDQAVQLLLNKLGDAAENDARQLLQALECIPLAVVQAASYINRLRPRIAILDYLYEIRTLKKEVHLHYKAPPDIRRDDQAPNSVFATWKISFDHIRAKRPCAADLLSFMSFFNRQGIPEFMIRCHAEVRRGTHDGVPDTRSDEEEHDFEEDIAVLRAFSLVSLSQHEKEFGMHGLVQQATQQWLNLIKADEMWRRHFIHAMSQEFPTGEYPNWSRCRTLYPHVLTSIGQVESSQVITAREEVFWKEHPGTLASVGSLAQVLSLRGKDEEAEAMFRQNLVASERVSGKEHPETLGSMNNLALLMGRQGKYEEAMMIHRETLVAREKVLSKEHPDTLASMNNLTLVLIWRGKGEEAETMHRETVAAKEKLLGKEHPDTLSSIVLLAKLLSDQHHYDEASFLYERAITGFTTTLGYDDRTTQACRRIYSKMLLRKEQQN
ncbi:MAG: hypothetical protein Q9165_008869 [Trypethelium subeluteriae]